jgi:YD repeat-containing protein
MRHNSFSYIISLAFAILLSVLTDSRAYSQNYWCRANEISWSRGSTDTKQFTIRSQDSLAFIVNASACHHFYVQTDERNYTVTIIPFSINNAQVDIVQNLYVTIDDYGTPVTETVVLRHCAAPASPDPDPGPEPEPDPWDALTVDLPDTLSWIQRTTITAADGSSYVRDATFYDGLGYPSQEVLVGASPGGLKSIYTPIVYDNMRRADVRTYLPYAAATAAEIHDSLAITRQASFYASFPYQDTRPYTEKAYETSPVGRTLSLQREGQDWNADGGHRSTFSYRTNLASDAVPRYRILPGTGKARYDGSWPGGTLHCTETVDEEGSVSRTFTDAFGKTILTESETGEILSGGGKEKARTLYIYDLRDSLAMVVQPEGMNALANLPPFVTKDISLTPSSSSTAINNAGITDKYCFVWTYDGRGNVLSEHTPGGGTSEYVYDARNRQVLRTDSRMNPADASPDQRLMVLTLHDQYDRIVEERYVNSFRASFETLRANLRNMVSHTLSPSFITDNLPTVQALRSVEYFPFGTITYATSGDGAFTPDPGVTTAADLETERIKGFLKMETIHPAPHVDGSIHPDAPSVTRYYHYDYKGRVIQTNERWSDGRLHRISTKYSFTGDVLAAKETVVIPAEGGGTDQVNSLATFYTRDPRGRVLTCSRVLDNTDTLATVHYAYDELGRLVGKTAGNANSPVLETDIEYDLHGWTTGIDVAMKTGTGGGMAPVFSETLRYATAEKDNNAKRYDGNIAETAFSHRIVPSSGGTPYLQTNTWSYAYDGLKRLTGASHYPGAPSTPSLTDTERGIGYDLNGNITALKRYGNTGLENDLSFTHDGNRMTSLSDAHATGTDAGDKSFTYDANGNLVNDGRKGLELRWNVGSVPSSVYRYQNSK